MSLFYSQYSYIVLNTQCGFYINVIYFLFLSIYVCLSVYLFLCLYILLDTSLLHSCSQSLCYHSNQWILCPSKQLAFNTVAPANSNHIHPSQQLMGLEIKCSVKKIYQGPLCLWHLRAHRPLLAVLYPDNISASHRQGPIKSPWPPAQHNLP